MTKFQKFKNDVLTLPWAWRNERNIYFSQMRDGYTAAYKPHYPSESKTTQLLTPLMKAAHIYAEIMS